MNGPSWSKRAAKSSRPLLPCLVAEVAERVVGGDERMNVVAAERGRGIVAAVVQTGAPVRYQISDAVGSGAVVRYNFELT